MAGVSDLFNDEQIEEFKEAFNLFDSKNEGTVYIAQIEMLMKALGAPTNDDELKVNPRGWIIFHSNIFISKISVFLLSFQQLMLEADDDDSGTIDFPEFLSLMAKVVSIEHLKICILCMIHYITTNLYEVRGFLIQNRGGNQVHILNLPSTITYPHISPSTIDWFT